MSKDNQGYLVLEEVIANAGILCDDPETFYAFFKTFGYYLTKLKEGYLPWEEFEQFYWVITKTVNKSEVHEDLLKNILELIRPK